MHKLVVLVAAMVAMSAVAAAQGARHETTSLSTSSLRAVYGHGITLSGTVSGKQAGSDVSARALELASQRLALHDFDRSRIDLVKISDAIPEIPLDLGINLERDEVGEDTVE